MAILSTKLLCVLSLLCSVTFAAPVVGGDSDGTAQGTPGSSEDNPIDATFDITGWPDLAEENCYAMLCLGKGPVLQVWPYKSNQDAD
jgi:hypothetical protein